LYMISPDRIEINSGQHLCTIEFFSARNRVQTFLQQCQSMLFCGEALQTIIVVRTDLANCFWCATLNGMHNCLHIQAVHEDASSMLATASCSMHEPLGIHDVHYMPLASQGITMTTAMNRLPSLANFQSPGMSLTLPVSYILLHHDVAIGRDMVNRP
jgi:hypothetical protein